MRNDWYASGPAKCLTVSMNASDRTVNADEGACIVVKRRSSPPNSLSLPTDWPMQRIVMRPFPAGPTFMIDVMVDGALGAQLCQTANSCAALACDNLQETPNTRTELNGNVLMLNSVATPKLPPPPPRHAQ